jgi:uncharacterized RDD family membrane protein YckC
VVRGRTTRLRGCGIGAAVTREVGPYQGRRAGVVSRVIAAVLDSLVVLFGYGASVGLLFIVDPLAIKFPRPDGLLSMGVALTVAVGYLTIAWTIGGRTYGALFMGLRVVGSRGQLRMPRALARAVVCVLFPIGLLWCAVNKRNRSLSDLLLRTSVIYDWSR